MNYRHAKQTIGMESTIEENQATARNLSASSLRTLVAGDELPYRPCGKST